MAVVRGIVWPDVLCHKLADSGARWCVNDRDTGLSSVVDLRAHPYDLADMAADAADVLTGLILSPADVLGLSLGGMLAQLLALAEPALVSLACAVVVLA
jgi:pimeloyl-ACP methyl ester carboxylesterase